MRGAFAGADASVLRLSEPQGRMILVPFDKRECMTLKQAADVAGKSESTMRSWAEQHGLGRRIGGAGLGRLAGSPWPCFWMPISMR